MATDERMREKAVGFLSLILIGGLLGICWGMLFRHDEERAHVHLDHSVPALFAGLGIGLIAGLLYISLTTSFPKTLTPGNVLTATLLGASILAPLGWIIGDEADRRGTEGMLFGALIGAIGGLLLGLIQWRWVATRSGSVAISNSVEQGVDKGVSDGAQSS